MKYEIFSYRYGQEILEHDNFRHAWEEIRRILDRAPLFIFPGKSVKNPRLDVLQQVMNTFFDRMFAVEYQWDHHPLATAIEGSQLKADYRKIFKGRHDGRLTVQAEVQFGNMARWYTDIFKFQTAYSDKRIQLGLSVIPMQALASRIDSNVVNFERATRELPSAELSITLPMVLIGLYPDSKTQIIDVSKAKFDSAKAITGRGRFDNQRRIVHQYLCNRSISEVTADSDPGPVFTPAEEEGTDA